MMQLSRWSIHNPVATTVLFVLLGVLGVLCFDALNIRNMPDLDLPVVTVTIVQPGATPQTLESEVVQKIEGQLSSIAGMKHTVVSITDSVASVSIEFALGKNVAEALEDVRSTMASLRSQLPPDIREPVITRLDVSSQIMLAYAVRSQQRSEVELSELVEDVIRPRLALISEVSRILPVGGVRRQLRVELDPVRIAALGSSATEVSRQLRRSYSDNAAGVALLGGREQPIRVLARVDAPQHMADLNIALADGRSVRLGDIARIHDGVAERTSAAFLDAQPVLGFELAQEKGSDQIRFARKVQEEIDALQGEYPDLQFTKTLDFVEVARSEYHGSLRLMLEGAILTVLIVWVFLRDRRATWISTLSLPLSIIPAFIGMYLLGFSINVVSLLAISLVIGVLVDDTIVEIENISRHLHMGKTPRQAALDATDEIGLAVVATTLTIVAVFLPTAFMGGIGGLFFRQFGMTTVFAVLASLLVARMLTPVLAAGLLKAPARTAEREAAWLRHYLRLASWCLLHRGTTIFCALLFFAASLALVAWMPRGFIPADDNTHTQVTLSMPPGTRLHEQVAIARQAREKLSGVDGIEQIYTTIGAGAAGANPFMGQGGGARATLTLRLAARGQRPKKSRIQDEIVSRMAELPGVRASVGLGASNDKYRVFLVGHERRALQAAATQFEGQLRQLPGLSGVQSESQLQRAQLAVEMDFARAADLGVSAADVAETLRVATVGDHEEYLAKFDLPGRQMPVLVRLDAAVRHDIQRLEAILVPGRKGPVRLGDVARLYLDSGPTIVTRLDGMGSAGFTISIGALNMGDVQKQVQALASGLDGKVHLKELGDAEASREIFSGFLRAMLVGALLIYAVLVLLFKDFLQPLTILAALPLASGGSFVVLLLAGQSLSLPALIGFIMLMGIVTKNSILLVDYAIVARQRGLARHAALLDACRKRARPIIMTSLAMGFGMLPVALAWGDADMSFRAPMGLTIIGGLITSTFLSLLVVPALFAQVDDLGRWMGLSSAAATPATQGEDVQP